MRRRPHAIKGSFSGACLQNTPFKLISLPTLDRIDQQEAAIKTQPIALLVACAGIFAGSSCAKPKTMLAGDIGSSPRWGSGWITFKQPVDFHASDRFEIKLGGTATRVMLRFLPENASATSDEGIVDGPLDVPSGRILEFTLSNDRLRTTEISVHGDICPWGKYELGSANGPATIESVSVESKR